MNAVAMPAGTEDFDRGNAYRFRTEGDRGENLRRAIACYESALAIVPSYARSVVLLSLGHAYRERGSLDDLRRAVDYYRQTVSSVPANKPADVAWAQVCLGMTYLQIAEDFHGASSADDIEESIRILTAALPAPGLTAEQQNLVARKLGDAYIRRRRGDRAANVEQALAYLDQVLASGGSSESLQERITLLVTVASLYKERTGGNRAENVEATIATATEAERLLGPSGSSPGLHPIFALTVQRMLGDAYSARMQGDPAANREAALEHHRAAAAFAEPGSQKWVDVTSDVADDLIIRMRGNPSSNFEEALAQVLQVLDVLDEGDVRRAAAMARLGSIYRQRIAGDKAENLEEAIRYHEAALTVITPELSPQGWARQQLNLGNAYAERLLGDRGDNLRRSASYLRSAADLLGPSVLLQWTDALTSLALTYEDLAAYGEPGALRQAVECLRQAQTVADRLEPARQAIIKEQLGRTLFRLAEDSPSAVQQAVGYLEAALQVFTADSAPAQWARVMTNLGEVQLVAGDRDKAISSLRAALTVRTREATPLDWAKTQTSLGEAYATGRDYQRAEACFGSAADVFRSCGFLAWWRTASTGLAEARVNQEDWSGAVRAFTDALEAAERIYEQLVLPTSKEAQLEHLGRVPAAAAYAAVRAGDPAIAARWLELGRARMLGDALARDRADLALLRQLDPAVAARFEAALNDQRRMEDEPAAPRVATDLRPNVDRTRDEKRRDLYRRSAAEYSAALAAARSVLGRPDFLATKPPEAAGSAAAPLVYLSAAERGGLAVILRGAVAEAIQLPTLTEADLLARVNRFLGASSAAADVEAWQAEVDDVTEWLWGAGLGDVADAINGVDLVTLVPCGALGVLPLHAAWRRDSSTPTGRRYFVDTAAVAYAPSARVLEACSTLVDVPPDRLLAVAEPQPVNAPRLRLAAQEAAVAAGRIPGGTVLASSEATVEAVVDALHKTSVAHFACHGFTDLNDPGRSGLVLAQDQTLDVRRIRAQQVRLRLAVLSACQTARPGVQLPDEVIGLPAALLQAGAGGVVATWWPVPDDLAVAVMLAFYERWEPALPTSSPSVALIEAQRWLRDASNAEIRTHLESLLDDRDSWLPRAVLESLWESVILREPHEHPFGRPAAWGAFGYYGQ